MEQSPLLTFWCVREQEVRVVKSSLFLLISLYRRIPRGWAVYVNRLFLLAPTAVPLEAFLPSAEHAGCALGCLPIRPEPCPHRGCATKAFPPAHQLCTTVPKPYTLLCAPRFFSHVPWVCPGRQLCAVAVCTHALHRQQVRATLLLPVPSREVWAEGTAASVPSLHEPTSSSALGGSERPVSGSREAWVQKLF